MSIFDFFRRGKAVADAKHVDVEQAGDETKPGGPYISFYRDEKAITVHITNHNDFNTVDELYDGKPFPWISLPKDNIFKHFVSALALIILYCFFVLSIMYLALVMTRSKMEPLFNETNALLDNIQTQVHNSNSALLADLNVEYQHRTESHNLFIETNTASLMEEIINFTSVVTTHAAAGIDVNHLTETLASATTSSDKMMVLKDMLVGLADDDSYSHLQPTDFLALFQAITARFVAMNEEMDVYSAFLQEINLKILEASSTPAAISTGIKTKTKRTFTLPLAENSTATSNTADLPTLYEISETLFEAAIKPYEHLLRNPVGFETPITTTLTGNLTLTAGINLSPTRENTLLICPATYIFTWVPDIGLTFPVYHVGTCTSYTFAQAEGLGMGIDEKGWSWYDEEVEMSGFENESLGEGKGGKFTFGDRDVGEVMWEVVESV